MFGGKNGDPPRLADLQCCSGNFVQGRRGSALAFHVLGSTGHFRSGLPYSGDPPNVSFFLIETLIKVVVGGL